MNALGYEKILKPAS